MASTIDRDALAAALDVYRDLDEPHVNLGPLLGTDRPLRVGLDDLHELLQSGEPTFSIEYGDAELTVRKQDGGMMATLALHW